MKVRIISIFKDKDEYSKGIIKVYPINTELEVSKERYKEIKNYVEVINTTKEKKTSKE